MYASMSKLLLLLVFSVSILSCHSLKKSDGDKGFTILFDGKTTNGWHTYGKQRAGTAWEVKDGTLHLNTKGIDRSERGDLVTDKEYENYHLKLEWKISEGGNSGIIFNVHEAPAKYGATYSTGPEMQVIDNDKHADAKIVKHRAGDLYDMIESSQEVAKPVGEWNKAEIISNNGKLDFYLNGVKIVSTTMFDANWDQLIANSKFATWAGFGIYKKGKIALQDHNDEVWYRNIMIREL